MNPPSDFKHPRSFSNIAERDEYLRRVFPQVSVEFAKLPKSILSRHSSLDKIIDDFGMKNVLGEHPIGTTVAVKRALLARYFSGDFTPFITPRESSAPMTRKHWLMRISDGRHFANSFPLKFWGINSEVGTGGVFLREASSGDILWFVRKKTGGVLTGCAEIVAVLPRADGPSTSELGWDFEAGVWNYLVKYDKFRNLSACEIPSGIVGQASIFRGGDNLEELYSLIKKLEKSTEEIWQNAD